MMRPATSASRVPVNGRTIALAVIVVLIVIVGLRALFGHHENRYETIAAKVTVALQKDDVEGVKAYQNAETATQVTAARVGRGADAFGPLGALKQTHETSVDPDKRVHQFDLTFEHGSVHETIKFDPQDKIVGFKYDAPQIAK